MNRKFFLRSELGEKQRWRCEHRSMVETANEVEWVSHIPEYCARKETVASTRKRDCDERTVRCN